jgi:Class II Aldolase and Adducin N-terminal domain
VTVDDIMEFDLDCNPIDQRGRPMYFERPIHGAIFRARPDVGSVVHNHAYETIPFGLTRKWTLRACVHPACALGTAVPVWDSRARFGDTDLLITNRERGHDLARPSQRRAAAPSRLRRGRQLSQGGGAQRHLSQDQRQSAIQRHPDGRRHHLSLRRRDRAHRKLVFHENSLNRMWDYWKHRAGDGTV